MSRAFVLVPLLLLVVLASRQSTRAARAGEWPSANYDGGVAARFVPQTVSFDDLAALEVGTPTVEATTTDGAARALREDGFVAVTDVPGYAAARREALTALDACVDAAPNAFISKHMADGTSRFTIAASSEGAAAADLDALSPAVAAACPAFSRHAAALRRAVSSAADVLTRSLDRAAGDASVRGPDGLPGRGFTWAFDDGRHLEHFHVYRRTSRGGSLPRPASKDTMAMHTDVGVLLAMTQQLTSPILPAESKNGVSRSGLFVESPRKGKGKGEGKGEGAVVEVSFAADALLFMAGEGASRWLGADVHAPPHAMRMPPSLTRAWFGLMVLPPPQATLKTSPAKSPAKMHEGKKWEGKGEGKREGKKWEGEEEAPSFGDVHGAALAALRGGEGGRGGGLAAMHACGGGELGEGTKSCPEGEM